jgi:histidine triad (HIT) family protein
VSDCPFCRIVAGDAPAKVVVEWDDALAIVPRSPVTVGHVLVIPRYHVQDAAAMPDVTASAMRRAAELASAAAPCNLITSVGAAATQTVYHLHIHVVPRHAGDGLALPWTPATRLYGEHR